MPFRNIFFACSAIIVLIASSWSLDTISQAISWAITRITRGPHAWLVPIGLIWLSVPFLPTILAAMRMFTQIRLGARTALVLAALTMILGLPVTLVSSAGSGPGSHIVMAQGLTLTLSVASSFLLMRRESVERRPPYATYTAMSVVCAAALWSIASVLAIVMEAERIADGRPFCIGEHPGPFLADGRITVMADSYAVESFGELRGFNFITTRSGGELCRHCFFHGIMVLDDNDGRQYFNWSPRRWRFDQILNPDALEKPIQNACDPSEDFWNTLSIL